MIGLVLATTVVINPTLTPGVVKPDFTVTQACTVKWGKDVRHVTTAMKRAVAQRYGLTYPVPFRVEFDHKIPRELGGADDVNNLWPQPWDEARHIKDPQENAHHKAVCAGTETLAHAQAYFRTWGEQ